MDGHSQTPKNFSSRFESMRRKRICVIYSSIFLDNTVDYSTLERVDMIPKFAPRIHLRYFKACFVAATVDVQGLYTQGMCCSFHYLWENFLVLFRNFFSHTFWLNIFCVITSFLISLHNINTRTVFFDLDFGHILRGTPYLPGHFLRDGAWDAWFILFYFVLDNHSWSIPFPTPCKIAHTVRGVLLTSWVDESSMHFY